MCELYIGSADNLNLVNNLVGLLLQSLLAVFGYCEHRGAAEGIACMHTERINVLNKAYCNHVAFAVAYYLKLKLLPAENGLFHKNLADYTCLKTSCTYGLKLFPVVYKSAAGTAHCICRTKNDRVSELVCYGECFIDRVGNLASCHLNAEGVHCLFELNAILTAFNGIHLYTDNLDIIFVKHTCLV